MRLLALYEHLFGPEMAGLTRCPKCGERLELPLSVPELRRGLDGTAETPDKLADDDGVEVRFRPLNSRDLAAAVLAGQADTRRLLAERSVVEARRDGTPIPPQKLPEAWIDRLAEHLAQCDPGAEILLDVECPECRYSYSTLLDVGELLWTALRGLARRLIREISILARTCCWSEAEILAMSHPRRRAYLEMLKE